MVSEHASPLVAPGGVASGARNVHVAELSAALVRRGHEVVVHTRRTRVDQQDLVRAPEGYEVVHVPAGPAEPAPEADLLPHTGPFARCLRRRWATSPPDLVHAHSWTSGLAALLGARGLGVPVVQTFHGLGAVERGRGGDGGVAVRAQTEQLICREVDGIVATSEAEAFELVSAGTPRPLVSVVPFGVDTALFSRREPEEHAGLLRRVVCAGSLASRNGFADVISAMGGVPDAELVIAGGPADVERDPEARRLVEHAQRRGVAGRVRLVGAVGREAMPALLKSADAVVCAPWHEPFGLVPLEAMACGVPVVATSVGGLVDSVLDGVTGRLVPPRDPRALALALRALLADRTRREAYGEAGVDRVRARYTWERVAEETERVYARAGAGAGLAGVG
ncbi:glycosyl transferase [Actinosynnema pretiosum]|uniref:Glycosyl transferase n=2 Tax=Actinosynnema pretiosum TaxID=42197 RepID=A0A290ZH31_9PSEU|nr:glycosyl transferase [Actinosynnema pretiosum]